MNITLNKSTFAENILVPASKLTDNISLKVTNDTVSTLVTSNDNSVILMCSIPCKSDSDNMFIIPDCKAFLRLFANITNDEATLKIESNLISYKSKEFSFKYHLLDETYFSSKKSISEDKINSLTFEMTFSLAKTKLSELLKYNSIIPDAEKLYIYTSDGVVNAKIGDEQKSNTNEIVTEIAEVYDGVSLEESLPINIQNILLLSFPNDKVNVSVNQALKIFKFETNTTKYIISGLVK